MSKTPRTDAVEQAFTADSRQNPQYRLTAHARQLETELAAALDAVKRRDGVIEEMRVMLAEDSNMPTDLAHSAWKDWIKTKLEG